MVLMLVLWMLGCAGTWSFTQATFSFANPKKIPGFLHGISFPDPITISLHPLWSG
jgi:hypothetical protein